MTDDDLKFKDIYSEEGDLNIPGVLYREEESSWSPTRDIDWSRSIELSDEKKTALADAVTQFHYSNASHLMLCGRLLEQAEDMDLKKLAIYLSFSKMRNVDVFGRYLGRVSIDTEIAPQTKEYLSRMSTEENPASLLLGMGVLGGTVGYGVLDYMRDSRDSLFQQIADNVREEKRRNEDTLVGSLSDLVEAADADELASIKEQAGFYRDRSEKIVLYHSDLLETLGFDPREVADHVLELTDEFYAKIGLDADELE